MCSKATKTQERLIIGRGRSAVVYADKPKNGHSMVTKVFTGEALSHLVLLLLTGAGNAYEWNEDAIETAYLRRLMLQGLLEHWFGDELKIPLTPQYVFDAEENAYALKMEKIKGRHALLDMESRCVDEIDHLKSRIMEPLQELLLEAGFDGLLWQAGYGNPVAASNFMVEEGLDGEYSWVWIDLESGVPALFAFNPLATLKHYLPASKKHGCWLFDDVDLDRLEKYLDSNCATLAVAFATQNLPTATELFTKLKKSQQKWKHLSRTESGVAFALHRHRITKDRADFYRERTIHWNFYCLKYGSKKIGNKLVDLSKAWVRQMSQFQWKKSLKNLRKYMISLDYRREIVLRYADDRLGHWYQRGFVSRRYLCDIRRDLRSCTAGEYLADFSIHLAIKPLMKFFQWVGLPALFGMGVISPAVLIFLMAGFGALGRTVYTGLRSMQAWGKQEPVPWIALSVGLLPVIGNFAYPLQLLYCSGQKQNAAARFLILDLSTAFGRKLPIWGGNDTMAEHFTLSVGEKLVAQVERLRQVFRGKVNFVE